MKRWILTLCVFVCLPLPLTAFAEMGNVTPKSKDIEVNFFGSLHTYPMFMNNVDLNSNDTQYDRLRTDSGWLADHNVRNEARLGWTGKGDQWDFLVILEADFNLSAANVDRGHGSTETADGGITGEAFGIEKLQLRYDFGPAAFKTGWLASNADGQTGAFVYANDDPFLGFEGKIGEHFSWDAQYIIIADETTTDAVGAIDADILDWRAYLLKGTYKMANGFAISPFYVYSDTIEQQTAGAKVHYLGVQAYGKLGLFTPRLELAYANGDTDTWAATGKAYDISAWGAYGSLDINLSPHYVPYFGGYYLTGDDNANDNDINAFDGISPSERFSPTFGLENGFVYQTVEALGTGLYTSEFNALGGTQPGYGTPHIGATGDNPGLVMLGAGIKGKVEKFSYKGQVMFLSFEDQGAIEDFYGKKIDSYAGTEFDGVLTYQINKHLSVGNVLSIFDPGDAIQDIRGPEYDDIGILDVIELKWRW